MLILLIIGFICASLYGVIATGAAVYFYATQQMTNKAIKEIKRDKRRSLRGLELWQTKALELGRLGSLRKRDLPEPNETPKPIRTFVAPSQAINDLKKQISSGISKVPPAISTPFLEDAVRPAI